MRFSIITPSFRQSDWLKLCVASVADQGVDHEHIVQDAGSKDGTLDWLLSDPRVKAVSEKDNGMYDAVNRGLKRSTGEILAYLNCDEQYLPGALQVISGYFDKHPDVDVLFGDALVVDAQGEFMCYRKVQVPSKYHIMTCHLATFTCATFFRRKVIDQHGLFFDTQWRDLGDADWVLRVLNARLRTATLRYFISSFTDTGENMNLSANAQRERRRMFDSAPAWARRAAPLLVMRHRLQRLFGGIYRQAPFDYAIYTKNSPSSRVPHHVARPTFRWSNRLRFGWI